MPKKMFKLVSVSKIKLIQWGVVMLISLPVAAQASDSVILLHGLARTDKSMVSLESSLKENGYLVINAKYPSTEHSIEKLAEIIIPKALEKCRKGSKVHFVTHSLGGILVRQYLRQNTINNLGRVVMLGPPNHGSKVVDNINGLPGFKAITGPAGSQLGSGTESIPNQLGKADFELGIIAGTHTLNPILSVMLEKPNDGKVSVASTKLEGMADHIELPVTHPFMMNNKVVISQVMHFLQKGVFDRSNNTENKRGLSSYLNINRFGFKTIL